MFPPMRLVRKQKLVRISAEARRSLHRTSLHHRMRQRMATIHERFRQHFPILPGDIEHFLRLGRIHRDRLLAQHMLSGS